MASRTAGSSPVSQVPAASAPEVPSHPVSRARTEKGRPASPSHSPCPVVTGPGEMGSLQQRQWSQGAPP